MISINKGCILVAVAVILIAVITITTNNNNGWASKIVSPPVNAQVKIREEAKEVVNNGCLANFRKKLSGNTPEDREAAVTKAKDLMNECLGHENKIDGISPGEASTVSAEIAVNPNRYAWPGTAHTALPPLETPVANYTVEDGLHTLTFPAHAKTYEVQVASGRTISVEKVTGLVHLSPGDRYYINPQGGPAPSRLSAAKRPEEYPYRNIPIGALYVENGGEAVPVWRPTEIKVVGDKLTFVIHQRSVEYDILPTGGYEIQFRVNNP